jgi:hypothetical protein
MEEEKEERIKKEKRKSLDDRAVKGGEAKDGIA